MQVAIICDGLGWDYEQYMRQPNWFITYLIYKRQIDGDPQNKLDRDTLRIDE